MLSLHMSFELILLNLFIKTCHTEWMQNTYIYTTQICKHIVIGILSVAIIIYGKPVLLSS